MQTVFVVQGVKGPAGPPGRPGATGTAVSNNATNIEI